MGVMNTTQISEMKISENLAEFTPCTSEEISLIKEATANNQSLPFLYNIDYAGNYSRYRPIEISDKGYENLLQLIQIKQLRSIKKCLIFFVVLTILGIACWLILLLAPYIS